MLDTLNSRVLVLIIRWAPALIPFACQYKQNDWIECYLKGTQTWTAPTAPTASMLIWDDGNGSMKTVLADSTWTLFNFVIYFFESNVALHKTQVLKCVVSTKIVLLWNMEELYLFQVVSLKFRLD